MKIEVDTFATSPIEFRALIAMFTVLADGGNVASPELPANLDIKSSHEPVDMNPASVTVYTSKNGEPYVGEQLNTADIETKAKVKIVKPKKPKPGDVIVDVNEGIGLKAKAAPLVDPPNTVEAIKEKLAAIKKDESNKAAKEKQAAAKAAKEKPVAPPEDPVAAAKEVVAAIDPRKTVEAVLGIEPETPADDSAKADKDVQSEIRKLNLQCAKYGKADEAKAAVREAVGGPCKLSEIPKAKAASIVVALGEIIKGAEADG